MQNAVQMVNLTFSYLGGLMALMVALALRRLIERERPGQSRDDGSRARTVRRRTR